MTAPRAMHEYDDIILSVCGAGPARERRHTTPPCEINLHNLHMDAKIAMYFRMWDESEEATAWPKGPHMT